VENIVLTLFTSDRRTITTELCSISGDLSLTDLRKLRAIILQVELQANNHTKDLALIQSSTTTVTFRQILTSGQAKVTLNTSGQNFKPSRSFFSAILVRRRFNMTVMPKNYIALVVRKYSHRSVPGDILELEMASHKLKANSKVLVLRIVQYRLSFRSIGKTFENTFCLPKWY
jgi:hypothetical protein